MRPLCPSPLPVPLTGNVCWSSGVERREPEVELVRVRRRQGLEDTAAPNLETRRSHVQQVWRRPGSPLALPTRTLGSLSFRFCWSIGVNKLTLALLKKKKFYFFASEQFTLVDQ